MPSASSTVPRRRAGAEAESRIDRFVEAIHVDHWAPIAELVERLDEAGFWDRELMRRAGDAFKRSYVRRMVKRIKDDTGWPVVASIELAQEDGTKQRVYMPETLFKLDDYRQVISYWRNRAHNAIEMANGYTRRARQRFHKQLPLPFPENE